MSGRRLRALRTAVLIGALAQPATAAPQTTPGASAATPAWRYSVSGEATIALSPDDRSYFNYSTEAYSPLRMVRFDGSGSLAVGSHFTFIGDLRLQGGFGQTDWQVRPYALFVRVRPLDGTPLDIQAGLIPPVFGAASRRTYGTDNPLIGLPLGYQYVTTLREDSLPLSVDALLARRGTGWLVRYPVGYTDAEHGVPLADGLHYPLGVEIRYDGGRVEASAAVTTGSLSVPNARDVGSNAQVSGRVSTRPVPALALGASASHGQFLTSELTDSLGSAGMSGTGDQTGVGFDAEYSRGHLIVRTEGIYSRWRLPQTSASFPAVTLQAFAIDVEGRYRILPGLYAAIRFDHLGFSDVCGSTSCLPWDAPVRRVEAGGGYSVRRNIILKAAFQYNRRDGTFRPKQNVASAQLMIWF